MKKIISVLFVVAIIIAIGWVLFGSKFISSATSVIAKNNSTKVEQIRIGMQRADVLTSLGKPERVEAYSFGNRVIEFLFYRIKGMSFFKKDNESNFTPIAIDNASGKVLSKDLGFYKNITKDRK